LKNKSEIGLTFLVYKESKNKFQELLKCFGNSPGRAHSLSKYILLCRKETSTEEIRNFVANAFLDIFKRRYFITDLSLLRAPELKFLISEIEKYKLQHEK
jgi:hypothetical protein